MLLFLTLRKFSLNLVMHWVYRPSLSRFYFDFRACWNLTLIVGLESMSRGRGRLWRSPLYKVTPEKAGVWARQGQPHQNGKRAAAVSPGCSVSSGVLILGGYLTLPKYLHFGIMGRTNFPNKHPKRPDETVNSIHFVILQSSGSISAPDSQLH